MCLNGHDFPLESPPRTPLISALSAQLYLWNIAFQNLQRAWCEFAGEGRSLRSEKLYSTNRVGSKDAVLDGACLLLDKLTVFDIKNRRETIGELLIVGDYNQSESHFFFEVKKEVLNSLSILAVEVPWRLIGK